MRECVSFPVYACVHVYFVIEFLFRDRISREGTIKFPHLLHYLLFYRLDDGLRRVVVKSRMLMC